MPLRQAIFTSGGLQRSVFRITAQAGQLSGRVVGDNIFPTYATALAFFVQITQRHDDDFFTHPVSIGSSRRLAQMLWR